MGEGRLKVLSEVRSPPKVSEGRAQFRSYLLLEASKPMPYLGFCHGSDHFV